MEASELALCASEPVTERARGYFHVMLARREKGEPLQYVLGCWGFRTLDLLVDERVLIPRPETEQVVEVALEELRRLTTPEESSPLIAVDLGTGSGAIALSLAVEHVTASVWGVDRSVAALAVARANLTGIGRPATRVRLVQGDWYGPLPPELRGTIDLVVSNPPYVSEPEVAALPDEVALWEPREALVAGPSGLEDLEHVVFGAPEWLKPQGALVVEAAPHQVDAVVSLAGQAGFAEVSHHLDLTGRPRVVVARDARPR